MLISPKGPWRALPGYAFGIRQPTLIGLVELGAVSPEHIERFDSVVHRLFPGDWFTETSEQAEASGLAVDFLSRYLRLTSFIQLQCRIAVDDRQLFVRRGAREATNVYRVALPCLNFKASSIAIDWVRQLVSQHVEGDNPLDSGNEPDMLREIFSRLLPYSHPGVNRFNIYAAANRLNIPWEASHGNAATLGTGKFRRVIISTITDKTPAVGVSLAKNKLVTASILRRAGLPGAENQLVTSADQAVEVTKKFGYPVVIKPLDLEQGAGVWANLVNEDSVRWAYGKTRELTEHILIEKHCEGLTHRMTVMHQTVVRVVRRIPGGVLGDGLHTIRQLVTNLHAGQTAQQMRTARRKGLESLTFLDEEALGLLIQAGMTPETIPDNGHFLRLRRRDNVNAGGRNEEISLSDCHPDNLALATRVADAFGLDVAGVDFITQDISNSWLSTPCLVCEVNAQPQIGNSSPKLYDHLLRRVIGHTPRIPVSLVLCGSEPSIRVSLRKELIQTLPQDAYLADRHGLFTGGERRLSKAFENDYAAARALILSPEPSRGIVIMDPEEIIKFGSPLDEWTDIKIHQTPTGSLGDAKRLKFVLELLSSARNDVEIARMPVEHHP